MTVQQRLIEENSDNFASLSSGIGTGSCTASMPSGITSADFKALISAYDSSGVLDKSIFNSLVKLLDQENVGLAIVVIESLLTVNPTSLYLNFLLGSALFKNGQSVEAIHAYKNMLAQPNSPHGDPSEQKLLYNANNNLGLLFKNVGLLQDAKKYLVAAIGLNPEKGDAYNNLGTVMLEMADILEAQKLYLRAVKLEPNEPNYYWNLQSTATTVNTAKHILSLCLKKGPNYQPGILTLAGLEALTGNHVHFNYLKENGWGDDPLIQSIDWVLKLPKPPEVHFNRWALFDSMAEQSNKTRPFYEFGVWMGSSFEYLAKYYAKGYGFDTFEGLPEDWGQIKKGSYSAYGRIPKVKNGDFVVGKFNASLPAFFSIKRPVASIVNYDADLYSSTLTALNYAHSVTDEETILIFDEFLVNQNWQDDESAALNEFCLQNNLKYEVLAVSLFTKQMACKLSKK